MSSTTTVTSPTFSRIDLRLLLITFGLWAVIAPVGLSYYGLQDLDFDAGIEWSYILQATNRHPPFSGDRLVAIWDAREEHYHHQLIQPILYLSYLPVSWLEPPLNAVRIVYAAYYLLFAGASFALLRILFADRFWTRFALTVFMLGSPSILSHLTSLEDNLIGYGPLLFGITLLIRYLREGRVRRLVYAAGWMAFSFLVGFTYISWILAMCAAPSLGYAYRDGRSGLRSGLLLSAGVVLGFVAWVLPFLLFKDWLNDLPWFTMLQTSFSSPAALYPGMVRELSPANLDRAGIEYMLRAFLTTLSGLPYGLVDNAGRAGLLVALAIMGLVIYIFARTLRRTLEPGEFAVAGVCLVVAAFQILYLAVSMEPTMYERNDWLVLWIPLAVFATGRHLPGRALRVTLLILAGLPPFIFATWSFGRENDHKEIRELRAEHPRVVFDNSHFNNPESSRGSSNFSEIGAVELAGLERCYVLADNTQGYLPLRCSFLTEEPVLARRIVEAEPEPFALTRAARIRLGYIKLDITCESLVERYTHCARKRTMMVDKQAAQFRRQVRELCDTFPEMLVCFEKSPDNCDSLHICVVESLQGRGEL